MAIDALAAYSTVTAGNLFIYDFVLANTSEGPYYIDAFTLGGTSTRPRCHCSKML